MGSHSSEVLRTKGPRLGTRPGRGSRESTQDRAVLCQDPWESQLGHKTGARPFSGSSEEAGRVMMLFPKTQLRFQRN